MLKKFINILWFTQILNLESQKEKNMAFNQY